MKNDINEIKNILEEEQTRARTEQELTNELIKELILTMDESNDKVTRLETIQTKEFRESASQEIAKNQKEFDYLFINYDKAIAKIKKIYSQDIKNESIEIKTPEKKEFTIFGLNWFTFLFIAPLSIVWGFIDSNNKRH